MISTTAFCLESVMPKRLVDKLLGEQCRLTSEQDVSMADRPAAARLALSANELERQVRSTCAKPSWLPLPVVSQMVEVHTHAQSVDHAQTFVSAQEQQHARLQA
jgi:hypothetical protein